MPPETQTLWFVRVWVLVAVLYDLYAIAFFPPRATISGMMAHWFEDNPILAVACGVLIGHWAWPIQTK